MQVANGKARVTKFGLLWGSILDPGFMPADDSVLLPRRRPSRSQSPVAIRGGSAAAAGVGAASVAAGAAATQNRAAPKRRADGARKQPEAAAAVAAAPAVPAVEPRPNAAPQPTVRGSPPRRSPSPTLSNLSRDQVQVIQWIRDDLGVEVDVAARRGGRDIVGRPAAFTSSSLSLLIRFVRVLVAHHVL
jgi:hypothetical protein